MLPFKRWRSMSGVRISGTRSRKYPVLGLPFTRTPTSRKRSTQRHTVERETPISLAMRDPLIAIVALSANNVSREASRRSVVPGREVGAMEAERSLLVLDGVHKQTEVCCGRGVRQSTGRKKIRSGLSIGTNIFERDAAGDFRYAVRTKFVRQLNTLFRFSRRHVIQQNGFRAGGKRFTEFAFVAHFDLNRQHCIR